MSITWTNEKRKLSDLIPWPRNPRQIKKAQVERLQLSLQDFGQVEPIAIGPGNVLYNGHQRLKSWAAKYGDIEIDVRVSSRELTEKERERLTILLHEGAAGEWNLDELANWDMGELAEWGFDLEARGLELPAEEPPADPGAQVDKAEELREKWGVEPGQLWRLGEHRLICGDCTDRATVERLMDGDHAYLCPTDPPYNVGIDYENEETDQKDNTQYEEFTRAWFALAQEFSDRQIVTPGCYNLAWWLRWFEAFYVAAWTKTNAMTHGYVSRFFCWEPIIFFGGEWFKGNEKTWKRVRANDVFAYNVSAQTMPNGDSLTPLHPCPKPVDLIVDFLENYTGPGVMIYEPFSGSGTTLIACERLGRKCRAVEISPAYVAVALQRWADMTGQMPELITS